jgi:hypothetical protein
MVAVLAFHHTRPFGATLADKFGNDPFVWVSPFLWSHCHARSRPASFGLANRPPLVRGHDAVFFLTSEPSSGKLVCDCVFVVKEVIPIAAAEALFHPAHPARHYHFDQDRSPHHFGSNLTRIADRRYSFVLEPPMPIGRWISRYVSRRGLSVHKYFRSNKIKNVRVISSDADDLYERVRAWTRQPAHSARRVLSMRGLRSALTPTFPGHTPIVWPCP